MVLGMDVGLSPGDSVLDGVSASSPKGGGAHKFSAHVYDQTAGRIKIPLGTKVSLSPGDFVLDGDQAPYPKRGGPQFSACVYCGQTAAWIKMPVGTEVGLGLRRPRPTRHCVRCGPSYPQKKGTPTPPRFLAHVYCGQTSGWMKTPLGTVVDLGPGHIVLDGVPAPAKGAQQPRLFQPMFIVATIAHLSFSYC